MYTHTHTLTCIYAQIPEKLVHFAFLPSVQMKRTSWKAKVVERNLALRILMKILKVNWNMHAQTQIHTRKHNTGDMILLSILYTMQMNLLVTI